MSASQASRVFCAITLSVAIGTALPAQSNAPSVSASTPAAPPNAGEQLHGARSPLERVVTLDLRNVRLEMALDEIDRQAHLGLTYTPRDVPLDRLVSVHGGRLTARAALETVLRGTEVEVRLGDEGIVTLAKRTHSALDGATIVGWVRDSLTRRPIAHAVITLVGQDTMLTVVTNDSGYYQLYITRAGQYVLSVRQVGYVSAEHEISVATSPGGSRIRWDVALRMTATRLHEVVTTATGPRRRMDIPNDVVVLDVDSLVATQPVSTVTDLLATRVPGLTVQRTSGAPGDPARLRLRGVSSLYESNDPIVIVDGVRVYYSQSDDRSANLAGGFGITAAPAAPSPLDQLDPQSIETIEVLKGPSAATLYGADAANGVIVVTTKRGRPGPPRWRMSASRGLSYMPGRYPTAYFQFGHSYGGNLLFCSLTQDCGAGADSLVHFQALNAPDLTILGHGASTQLALGVDGGTSGLTYSLTGSYDDETGILKLPGYAATEFHAIHGYAAPDWMQRPQSLSRWSGTGRVTAQLGHAAEASVTTTVTRETQQRSSLEQQLSTLMGTYVDRATGTYYQLASDRIDSPPALVPDFYQRATDAATNFTSAATVTWHPRSWLTTSADAGLNVIARNDEVLLPRDMLDTLGRLGSARGSSVLSTVNLRALATAPLPWGFHLQLASGANYTKTSIADLATSVIGLADGATGLNGAGQVSFLSETVRDVTNAGWYVEPSLAHRRFFLSAGLRFDGGSTYGAHVSLPTFPKLAGSWLISDESWFPLKSVFNTLRLRAAYGHAGVQPGITDRLRLYHNAVTYIDGALAPVTHVSTLGNTRIKPERSTELEGGFDADLFNDRVAITLSGYRKVRKDALLQVPVAPSVYGSDATVWKNIGVIRNTGFEATLTTQLVQTDPVTWSLTLGVSRNRNLVLSLAPGVEPFYLGANERVAPGYPLFGRWAKPIKGYADTNGDGIIQPSEVQVGDSLVFMGEALPNYEASLHTTFRLLRGTITVDAGLDYQDGLTQVNQTAKTNRVLSYGANDPGAPLREQAAVVALDRTDYGLMQTVNTLRFNSLSLAYNAPPWVARRIAASALTIAVQGTNLGLFTNYVGKDPNVNAYATGNAVADTGVLPQPRSWRLALTARY